VLKSTTAHGPKNRPEAQQPGLRGFIFSSHCSNPPGPNKKKQKNSTPDWPLTKIAVVLIGYWLLAIVYWLLAIGYWLLAIGSQE
jgi:hypothetical protein